MPSPQPEGLKEISRGLRSAERDDTPGKHHEEPGIPEGCQRRATTGGEGFWHPFRGAVAPDDAPGVSLRSTPG